MADPRVLAVELAQWFEEKQVSNEEALMVLRLVEAAVSASFTIAAIENRQQQTPPQE